jgi:3-deoxy-D-manno-octulosonic-acid transferase
MFLLYSALYCVALALLLPFQYLKRPKALRKRWLRERLGGIAPKNGSRPLQGGYMTLKKGSMTLWVHAVSVGEVMAASTFIKALKERHPGLRLVVSTVTDTGQKVAQERLSSLAEIIYLPFDVAMLFRRAADKVRPGLFIVMETELWPNALRVLRKRGIPVIVLNGRISDASFKGYKLVRFFIKTVLQDVTLFCMQEELYADRIVELGADRKNVIITGNFKFDIKVLLEEPRWALGIAGPVIVAGSTHKGEEDLIVSTYIRLREDFGDLTLIVAPRHPERFDEVEGLIRAKGLPCLRRSLLQGPEPLSGSVVLLDTVGELSSVYSVADIAVIGGSFIGHGGQNPLEPAYWGKPVVCGPHMENFPFISEFYETGAAARTGGPELYQALKELLLHPERRDEMGRKAGDLLKRKSGSVDKALRAVEEHLEGHEAV